MYVFKTYREKGVNVHEVDLGYRGVGKSLEPDIRGNAAAKIQAQPQSSRICEPTQVLPELGALPVLRKRPFPHGSPLPRQSTGGRCRLSRIL